MAGVNKVILLGNLGRDPEVRHLENGRAVANFSIATSETYKNKQGEKVTNTEWHNVVLWTPLAEIAEKYMKKGNQVYIEGKLTSRSYEDKEGVTKYITEVVGRELTLLGGPRQDDNSNARAEAAPQAQVASTETTLETSANESSEIDDLPF
ncbi:MAG: single-stranded DNA-binding protein [Reichenbachiella sp.]